MIAKLLLVGSEVALQQVGNAGLARNGILLRKRGSLVDVLVIEACDALWLTVFKDLEVICA